MLFEEKIEREENLASSLLKDVSKNTESVEKKWNNFMDEIVGVNETFVKEIQKNAKFTSRGSSRKAHKVQDLLKANGKIREKHDEILQIVAEIQESTDIIDIFHGKTRSDQRRLSEIEAKIEAIQKLDKSIANVLEREFKNAEKIKTASRNQERMYGVWELTSGYKLLLRHLGTTLDMLEALKDQSGNKSITPIGTVSTEELEILISMFKRLNEMITAEISYDKGMNQASN